MTKSTQVKGLVANLTVVTLNKMLKIKLEELPEGVEEITHQYMSTVIFIDKDKAIEDEIPISTIVSRQLKKDGKFQFPLLSIYSLMVFLEENVFNPLLGSVKSYAYYKENLFNVLLNEINVGFDRLVLIIRDLLNKNVDILPYTDIIASQYAFKFFDYYVNSAMRGIENHVQTILQNKYSPTDRLGFRLSLLTKQLDL
jgi:hypothetical protein